MAVTQISIRRELRIDHGHRRASILLTRNTIRGRRFGPLEGELPMCASARKRITVGRGPLGSAPRTSSIRRDKRHERNVISLSGWRRARTHRVMRVRRRSANVAREEAGMFSNALIVVAIAFAASSTPASARNHLGFPDIERGAASAVAIAAEERDAVSAQPYGPTRLGAAPRERPTANSSSDSAARDRASIECQRARSRHDHAAERGAAPAWITPCAQSGARGDDLSSATPGRTPLHDHRRFHKQQ